MSHPRPADSRLVKTWIVTWPEPSAWLMLSCQLAGPSGVASNGLVWPR